MIMIAQTPENPADVSVLFSKNTGCFLPGTFTNRVQAVLGEPRLLGVTNPRAYHQLPPQASYINLLATVY